MLVDFHIHTSNSDGEFDVSSIEKQLNRNNVKYASITDHNFWTNTLELKSERIKWIQGIELYAMYKGSIVHILGYGLKNHSQIKILHQEYTEFIGNRLRILLYQLLKQGIKINVTQFTKNTLNVSSITEAIKKELGVSKESCIYEKYISPIILCKKNYIYWDYVKVINYLSDIGAVKVLAHPLHYNMNNKQIYSMLGDMQRVGLDGMESIYNDYNIWQQKYLFEVAKEKELLVTAGSDFHGIKRHQRLEDIKGIYYQDELMSQFLEALDNG